MPKPSRDALMRCLDFAFVNINDVLVARTGEMEHLNHLEVIFKHLADNG